MEVKSPMMVLERLICQIHKAPRQASWAWTIPPDARFDDLTLIKEMGRGPILICDECCEKLKSVGTVYDVLDDK
jgi:hypothetical protein